MFIFMFRLQEHEHELENGHGHGLGQGNGQYIGRGHGCGVNLCAMPQVSWNGVNLRDTFSPRSIVRGMSKPLHCHV